MLVLTGCMGAVNGATETTVYYAVPSDVVNNYTVKLNVHYGTGTGDGDGWELFVMNQTSKTYFGKYIYTYTFKDHFDGLARMQFQLYGDGANPVNTQVAIGNGDNDQWTGVAEYNGKMYEYNIGWRNYRYDKTFTVHCKKTATWTPSNAYNYFDDGATYGGVKEANWPGSTTTVNTVNSDWYDYTISGRPCDYVIFNDGVDPGVENTNKTPSIAIEDATEYWVSDGPSSNSATSTPPASFTYTRSGLSVGKFGTICMPYAIASVTGAKLYKIASQVKDGGTLTGVNLEEVTSGFVAGESYIFEASAESFTVTLSGSYTTTAADANGLQGNLSADAVAVTNDGSKYVIQDNKVKKVVSGGSGVTCGQYRAYITLTEVPDAGSSPAPGLLFLPMFGGETTGIENAVKSEEIKDKSFFNLAGQRVAQPTKGLYTANGRKVVIK